MDLADTTCIHCGQCIAVLPCGSLEGKRRHTKSLGSPCRPQKARRRSASPVGTAQLGESFGLPVGTNVEGKIVAALRRLGFDKVFDVDTAADLTIMEEGTELLPAFKTAGSCRDHICSPGWIKFCEYYYPEFIEKPVILQSPQQRYGAIVKTYYAQQTASIPRISTRSASLPCTAKKFELPGMT
jgi:NADP-reducing hydrogenase subunit HndD